MSTRFKRIGLIAGLILLLTACGDVTTATSVPVTTTAPVAQTSLAATTSAATTSTSTTSATTGATTAPTTKAAPVFSSDFTPGAFERVFIIVLENTDFSVAVKQGYMSQLVSQGVLLKNYFAVIHPSYPNYLAMIGGSTFNVKDDGQVNLPDTNLVDLMEPAGISWKVYAEGLPTTPCYSGITSGAYARKHEPFISFINVQSNPARCANIVNSKQLQVDVAANKLANFNLYVPDMNNDGHDTGAKFADKWLQGFLPPLLDKPVFKKGTLVVITYDEGLDGGTNQIYTLLLGDMVKAGTTSDKQVNHYNLLRTIEDNFKLGNLGREDAKANPITGVWNIPR